MLCMIFYLNLPLKYVKYFFVNTHITDTDEYLSSGHGAWYIGAITRIVYKRILKYLRLSWGSNPRPQG